jgi:hypothetical protein
MLGVVPAVTAFFLFVVLVFLSALDTPGGDLATPLLGIAVSAVCSGVVFVGLRRQPVVGYTHRAEWAPRGELSPARLESHQAGRPDGPSPD